MPEIRLRDNIEYQWFGQHRKAGETYEMGDGEAAYVAASGFAYDPDEVAPTKAFVPAGRFAEAVQADIDAGLVPESE